MSIATKLQEINNVKQAIKTAISNKGVDMYNVPFTSYATKIGEIQTGGGGSQVKIGVTQNPLINTGLSRIEYFFLYCSDISSTGLMSVMYKGGDSCTLTFCGDKSAYMSACKIKTSYDYLINGGTFEWKGIVQHATAFQNGVSYNWVAIGS